MDYYNYLNPTLIFVITCRFIYIVRLFVYQIEAAKTIQKFYKRSIK
jgi:uncharacterized membrane protein